MERIRVVVHSRLVFLQGLVVKLRSLDVRIGRRDAVDSPFHRFATHHFATGMVVPSATTIQCTAYQKRGANPVVCNDGKT
jgi:hypothetical protein